MAREIGAYNFTGGMNSDIALEKMPVGDYLYALNIDNGSTADGEVALVKSIKGNTMVSIDLPTGSNKSIGTCKDEPNKKLYFFVYNSNANHSIYRYDYSLNTISLLLQSPILNFNPAYLILHADMAEGKLMYWVDGYNPARKVNVEKLATGEYSDMIEEFISAYKRAPMMPPIVNYLSDLTKSTNFIYGGLFKFIYRHIFDDGEKSHFSDYSKVATPINEGLKSDDRVTNENNYIEMSLETGSRIVKLIEIGMQRNGGDFVSIAILNKSKLNIPDNTLYNYSFYNDGSYSGLDPSKVIKPYNFLPDKPKTQKFIHNAITYGNFPEGFPDVALQVSSEITQENYNFDATIEEKHNSPILLAETIDEWYDGGGVRRKRIKITIGHDVKKGNKFTFIGTSYNYPRVNFVYLASEFDDAYSVANLLLSAIIRSAVNNSNKNQLVVPLAADGLGNVTFQVDVLSWSTGNYFTVTSYGAVSTIKTSSITGESKALKAIKNGSTVGYGIVYEDIDGRHSSVYTNDNWLIGTPFITQSGYLKVTTHKLTINHKPPIWAHRYQIVRTGDLIYNSFIQMLIQRSILVEETNNSNYYDLVVGSLTTYNKIHENSILKYEFKKGDRLRLIKNNSSTYYPFYETEVLSYKKSTETIVDRSIVTNATDIVTLENAADSSNVGRTIKVGEETREIIEATGNTYRLSSKLIKSETFSSYTLYDFRGIVRIRKPDNITITDLSLVEIYNPAFSNSDTVRPYFAFGEKYDIYKPGEAARAHFGNKQNQDTALPAIVEITSGDSYIKAREIPTTNKVPGAQIQVEFIEDRNLSDFYDSDMSDLGRAYLVDPDPGIKFFPNRIRYSNNFIEGTRVNGLNDFDNLERVDLNDAYGEIKLLKYQNKRLYVFKDLRTGWMDVYANRISGQENGQLVADSDKLLSNIQYFGWQGGIGNNPESFASFGFRMYFSSSYSGAIIRLSTDGETPIDEVFGLDSAIQKRLDKANKNRTRIFGGFEPLRKQYVLKFEQLPGETDLDNTLAFKEGKKTWVSYYSYAPEMMTDFLTDFYTFKDGKLWIHNTNPIHCNFYGVQYKHKIHFVANKNYHLHKLYYGIKIDSSRRWNIPAMYTDKNEKFPNGTRSRLKENNFIQEDGKYYADIMKDMSDPRFTDTIKALNEGREVQGSYLILELENENINESKLKDVYLYSEETAGNF